MKKLYLMIMIGLFISSYSYSQNPCISDCTCIDSLFFGGSCQSPTDFEITIGSCVLTGAFSFFSCPGTPQTFKIKFLELHPLNHNCTACCSLTPPDILPVFFDYIIKHSTWIKHNFLDTLSFGTCDTNFSLVTPVCWHHGIPACDWGVCNPTSCCLKLFQICKDPCGIITTSPLQAIRAADCDSTCKFNIYCE